MMFFIVGSPVLIATLFLLYRLAVNLAAVDRWVAQIAHRDDWVGEFYRLAVGAR